MNIDRIPPQRDVRLMYAEPKNKCWDHVDPACGPKLYECHNSRYRMGQSLEWGAGSFDGSGAISAEKCWRCPDCGSPIDLGNGDDVPSCCSRCGSTESAVLK